MKHWLLKSEPDTWSWCDQLNQGKRGEVWDGVRNHQAANFLKEMKKGDLAFFYHSGKNPCVIGIVKIIRESFIDPTDEASRFVAVTVSAEKKLSKQCLPAPVTLKEIKSECLFDEFLLVKQSRLSVMPVSTKYWNEILRLSAKKITSP
ncbi:MAG: EVE domain-containing protein [Cellvibrionaceae bacterium]